MDLVRIFRDFELEGSLDLNIVVFVGLVETKFCWNETLSRERTSLYLFSEKFLE
jgi:hypothetical protein